MENLLKYLTATAAGVAGAFAHISALIAVATIFVAIDFVSGVLADRRRAHNNGSVWLFESRKAWRTINKLACIMAGIILAWLIDSLLLDVVTLRLANIFTGFVCGIEFWSYLENAAVISSSPLFRRFKQLLQRKLEERIKVRN